MTNETPSHRGDCAEDAQRTGVSDKEPGMSPLMTEDLARQSLQGTGEANPNPSPASDGDQDE